MTRVIQRLGRALEIARAGQPNEAVPQIFPLEQEEDQEDNDDGRNRQGLEQRSDDVLNDLQRRRIQPVDIDWSRR